jgi:hypothetical protein
MQKCHRLLNYFLLFYFYKRKIKSMAPPIDLEIPVQPEHPVTLLGIFLDIGRNLPVVCIVRFMTTYVYQIQGALENVKHDVLGFRVFLCTATFFDSVDIPAEIFSRELLAYMKFRLAVTERVDMRKLPNAILNKLRDPMNRWLDQWVLENVPHGN